jgi:hypothetical protein
MTTPLPPTFQGQLEARQHQTGLKQTATAQPSAEMVKYYDALQAGHDAWLERNPGKQPTKADILTIQQQAAGAYDKLPVPGSLGERKLKADVGITEAEERARPDKLTGEVGKNAAETARIEQTYRHEETLAPYKLDKLKADIELARTNASTVGQKAALGEMLANLKEAQGELQAIIAGAKHGLLDSGGAAKALANMYNRLGSQLEMVAPDRSWAEQHVPFLKEPAIRLVPKGGVTPQAGAQSQAQSTPQQPAEDQFKGAPKGKNPGALLKDSSGRAVARWDGQRWIPLEGE